MVMVIVRRISIALHTEGNSDSNGKSFFFLILLEW